MTTKFTSPVFRETLDSTVRDGKAQRNIIVGLEPGDVVSVRLKQTQKKVAITAQQLYFFAMRLEGERLLANKLNK
jgi:hypothetical protein